MTGYLIRNPEDHFRISYHQPARRLSEAAFRIAKRSIGKRISPNFNFSQINLLKQALRRDRE